MTPQQRNELFGRLWREECAWLGPEEAARERLRHEAWLRTMGRGSDEVVEHSRRVLDEETRTRAIAKASTADLDLSRPN